MQRRADYISAEEEYKAGIQAPGHAFCVMSQFRANTGRNIGYTLLPGRQELFLYQRFGLVLHPQLASAVAAAAVSPNLAAGFLAEV